MPKQTAVKAHVTGAVVALATFFLSLAGVVDAPPIVDTAHAIQPLLNALVEAGVTGALTWVAAWFAPRNQDKPAPKPVGSVQAHPLATLGAIALTLALLAGCAGMLAETPAQRVYAAKGDALNFILTADSYAAQCELKAPELKLGCDDHVRAMQDIVRDGILPAIESADDALATGADPAIAAAASALSAAVLRLQGYLIEHKLKEEATRHVTEHRLADLEAAGSDFARRDPGPGPGFADARAQR